ncbi:MAG TPA: hypothetical protein VMH33_02715 [Solirubrobacterales bacterium]|nr:hypothetical protein [Solirubrobacterales bacterium]
MSDRPGRRTLPSPGEDGAARLLALLRAGCAAEEDFPSRLEAALRTSLDFLAADPDLAYLLTVEPYLGGDEEALAAQRVWIGRFGCLLREAVATDPRTTTSDLPFLADFVIGGVRHRIARLVLNGEAADLPRLLSGLLEGVLSYYFDPGELRLLAHVAPELDAPLSRRG